VPIAGLDKISNAIACPPTLNPLRPPPALVAIFKQEIIVGVIVGVGVTDILGVLEILTLGVILGVIDGVDVNDGVILTDGVMLGIIGTLGTISNPFVNIIAI
jgi:hypothetical protein